MSSTPVDSQATGQPVDGFTAYDSIRHPARNEENSILGAILTDRPIEEIQARIKAGGTSPIIEARQVVEEQRAGSLKNSIDITVENLDPHSAEELLRNDTAKQVDWSASGTNLFLEDILALQDPRIDAEVAKYARNLQIGQELMEEALKEAQDETGVAGYVWDFVDRYFLRAMIIGGFEDLTGRSVRGGREHLQNSLTMNAQEYESWMRSQISQIKEEGFFTGENIYAMQEEFGRYQNQGIDPLVDLWRVLGVVDLIPLGGAVTKVVKAGTRTRRAKAVAGPEAADDLHENLLRVETTPNPRTVNDGRPEVLNPISDPDGGATLQLTGRLTDDNKILNQVRHMNESATFGRGEDATEVVKAGEELTNALRATTNNPLVNIARPITSDATGGLIWKVQLGTVKTGSPFKTEAGAAKAALKLTDEFPTAKAEAIDPTDASKGYYVSVDQRLDTDVYTTDISFKSARNAVSQMLLRFAGSTAATENKHLNTLAVMAEAAGSALQGGAVAKKLAKSIKAIPVENQKTVSKIFTELRDGSDAGLRNNYNDTEFAQKFRQYHPESKSPTPKDLEAFDAIRQINDASYMLRAHSRIQKYVSKGYLALELPDGTRVPGRIVDNTDMIVMDASIPDGAKMYADELPEKARIWELDRDIGSGIEYITNPMAVKSLDHSDVLGYNAGGRRINPDANYFLVGNPRNPRAFLTTHTQKQANIATSQIDAIRNAWASNHPDLDSVVRSNNDWNPELQTMEQFTEFQTTKGVDLLEEGAFPKLRDGEMATGEVRDGFSTTWDDYVTYGARRSDDVLTEFGGGSARNHDPVKAIFDDFGSVSHQYAYNTYTQTALNSWVKSARRTGSGWKIDPGITDPRRAFESAEKVETTNPAAAELGLQHSIIKQRLGMKSEVFQHMESYGASLQEFVFNKTGKKVLSRDPAKNAANNLLTFGFQSAFGLGNVSQFFVQGYHALTIAALTQNSVTSFGSGMKAIGMVPALSMALHAPDKVTRTLAFKRLAKFTGLDTKQMDELVDYIETSGRDVLDGSMMESGTGSAFGVSGWKGDSYLPSKVADIQKGIGATVKGTLKAGLIPFNSGERAARLTGITTAVLEYQAKYPSVSLKSTHARQWISAREQNLTFRMSNANRAFMQQGFGKLPTQWFTYTLRSMENVMAGRDFTRGEQARLAAALFPAFGLTGMGAAWATDWVSQKIGAEAGGEMETLIKYGIIDSLLEMGGAELAVADRLAPITLIGDVYSNITGTQSAVAAALGPSGNIASGAFEQAMRLTSDAINGRPVMLTEDAIRFARQWSGIDNVFKAMGIMNTGLYRGRNGTQLPFELTSADAIAQLFGFSAREVSEFYAEKKWQYNTQTSVKDLGTEIRNDFTLAMDYLNSNDTERGYKLLEEINMKIQFSGLSPVDQASVRRQFRVTSSKPLYDMQIERYKRGDHHAGQRLGKTFDFIGTN
jgi:hypothetical protein